LFAKQTPNYRRYLSYDEEAQLDEANKYDQLPAKTKLLRKLNNSEATKLDAQKMAKKTLVTNLRKLNRNGPTKEKLQIYKSLKQDGKKEEAKEFADRYILSKNPLRPRAARAVPDAEGGEAEQKEGIEEEAPPKHNLRSSKKANLKEQIESVEQKTKARKEKQKTKQEPEFVDEPEEPKPKVDLTPSEQTQVDRKFKKLDATVKDIETNTKLIDNTMKQIQDLEKTESKTAAPTQLRTEIKKIYSLHGKSYNANKHLKTIYKDLADWKEQNNGQKEKSLFAKELVVKNVIHKRNKGTPKKGNEVATQAIEE
jgi:hypothetical protein